MHADDFMDGTKRPKVPHAAGPEFFDFNVSFFRDYGIKTTFSKGKSHHVYASTAFSKHVFGDDQGKLADPMPASNLRKLMTATLPGYNKVFAGQYQAEALICANYSCLDLAYCEAVWRYSKLMGPKRFPPGTEFISSAELAAPSPASASVVVGAASSSSSAAPALAFAEPSPGDGQDAPMAKAALAPPVLAVAVPAPAGGMDAPAAEPALAPLTSTEHAAKPMGYTGPSTAKKAKKAKKSGSG